MIRPVNILEHPKRLLFSTSLPSSVAELVAQRPDELSLPCARRRAHCLQATATFRTDLTELKVFQSLECSDRPSMCQHRRPPLRHICGIAASVTSTCEVAIVRASACGLRAIKY